ncbi:carboxypeptidase regulatory-like domain-containing protein [Corallococcus sp. AB045]|uniref:carboxypeptidase-like regulatory domain-containing protein n=1 Tax=Corallococcus sp. AB045 TaxID=2316719 RepID=UPI000EE2577C|nr:carboxypeptidase-like regulatory domain-containing protein [Corallococcus sp. AB045]RKH86102.1 carboxypeptidase regulatory-like domain-containing protein [Corallococcus sp. AB045]
MRWSQVGLVVGMLACAGTSNQKPVSVSEAVRTEAAPASVLLTVLAKDAEGRPLPHIEFRIRNAMAVPPEGAWGTTSGEGQGRLWLPSGWYVLTAQASGYQGFVDPDVRLGREHPATVTMTLRPSVPVAGRVVDGVGKPLRAVSLSWIPTDTTAPRLDVVGNPDGSYLFEGMGSGPGVLLARLKGYSDERRVFDAPPADLTLVMREQGTLRVTAFAPDGRPVRSPNVTVKALEPVAKEGAWIDEQVKDAQVYRGLEAGRYRVTFTHPLGGNAEWNTSSEVEVVAGQTRELALRFEGVVERAPLRGRVVDANGQPVADVWLSASSGDPKKDAFASEDSTRTDTEGRFTLEHLSRGPVRVEVSSGVAKVEFGPEDAKDVLLERHPSPFVEGRVTGPDGKALTRFKVNSETYEDPEGRYRYTLEGPWPASLVFEAEGLASTRTRVEPREERTALPDVSLKAVRTVRIRLLRENGQPAGSTGRVNLRPLPGRESTFAWFQTFRIVDAEGRDVLENVPREPFILEAETEEEGTASQPLGADVEEVTVRLAPAALLLGTVADEAGRPLQGIHLMTGCETHPGRLPVTDAEGRFRIRLNPGRECFLSVYSNGGPSGWPSPPLRVFWPRRFTSGRPGETVRVDLRPRTGPASVQVMFPDAGEWDRVLLVPGDVPMPSTVDALRALMDFAAEPDPAPAEQRPERQVENWFYRSWGEPRFSQLPLGRYTVFVLASRVGVAVLRYPVNLTEPGVHRFETKRADKEGVHFVR